MYNLRALGGDDNNAYATRLDRLRELEECRDLIAPLDQNGLLSGAGQENETAIDELDDDALLAELGIEVIGH